jgi:Rieske Fe-S protein
MKVITSYLLGLTGALGILGVTRYLGFEAAPPRKTVFDLGPASAFAVNTRTRLRELPAVLIRNEHGYSAMSLTCTHLGCTVDEVPEGFACPCHGSRYDGQGAVARGPATEALERLRTEVTADGKILLYLE